MKIILLGNERGSNSIVAENSRELWISFCHNFRNMIKPEFCKKTCRIVILYIK